MPVGSQNERAAAESARHAAGLALQTELAEQHARLASAHARASVLKEKVLPAMEGAYAAAGEGYRQGKLGYLDVLDAQRSLFETHQSLLTTLSTYQHGLATMDRLTGEPLAALETHP